MLAARLPALRKKPNMSNWKDKVVVVTGGSDGLGLEIVRIFATHHAPVISLARNPERNNSIAQSLTEQGLNVTAMTADVTRDESVHAVVEEIVSRFGRIDVWVNNVGKSTRADVMQVGVAEYRTFLEINFLAAVRCWNACQEELIKSSGNLINIGSLASKTAWPLMSPYSTSKHALAAFSQQLRLEGPSNVNVLHVCPGPIKRNRDENRYAAESEGLGQRAKLAGAGAAIKGIEPAVIAQKIVRGCELRKGELVIPWSARLLFAISQLSATVGDGLLKRFIKN